MSKLKTGYRLGFLGVIAAAVGFELFALFDGNPDTETLTHLVKTYIPAYVSLPIIGAFAIWLINHFIKAYKGGKNLKHGNRRKRTRRRKPTGK